MHRHRYGWPVFLLAFTLSASGCSSTALKTLRKENADLKQKVMQDEAALKEQAEKLAAAEKDLKGSRDRQQRAEAEIARLRKELEKALETNQAIIRKLKSLTVVEMPYDVLFAAGQADLSPQGIAMVEKIAQVFARFPNIHMRIEGHTDNLPIGTKLKPRFDSNWELSSARAATVAKYLIYHLHVPPKRLYIAGFADTRPVAGNDLPEDRARNRRIRVVLIQNEARAVMRKL